MHGHDDVNPAKDRELDRLERLWGRELELLDRVFSARLEASESKLTKRIALAVIGGQGVAALAASLVTRTGHDAAASAVHIVSQLL